MIENFIAFIQSVCRLRKTKTFIAACPQITVPLFGNRTTLPSIFGSLLLAAFMMMPISLTQAAAITTATGFADNATAFSHAQAGGRQATAIAYAACPDTGPFCTGLASADAVNTYNWRIFAAPGFEGVEARLSIGFSLSSNFALHGTSSAALQFSDQRGIHNFSITSVPGNVIFSSVDAFATVTPGNPFTTIPFTLSAQASVSVGGGNFDSSLFALNWAIADPIVTIDPSWEFASNFSLEEVANPLQFDGFGSVPAGLDLQEIPIELVGVVPVPAAVWLFGSALGLLTWIRRKAV